MKLGNDLNIILGYSCNYRCGHCITSSGPDKKDSRLSDQEVQALVQTVRDHNPESILFTGGEPTLFPEVINQIAAAHPHPDQFKIKITSNGWYGVSEKLVEKTLNQIKRIDTLQMSFDVFHGNESKIEFVKNIAKYCESRNIQFNVTMCLSTPMDLVKAQAILQDLKVNVIFQPIISTGRALENKLEFHYPKFDKETLNKKCPNLGSVVAIPKKGFSVCCNNLIYGKQLIKSAVHDSIPEHESSTFYRDISSLTMGELAKKHNVDTLNLSPAMSNVCQLCEHIHQSTEVRR